MKLHVDSPGLGENTGPRTFTNRLLKHLLMTRNIELVDNGQDADISFVVIEPSGVPLAKKIVHRLDGIWSAPNGFVKNNTLMKRMYEHADTVIFQSLFDKNFIVHNWGLPNDHHIIRNGVPIKPVTQFASKELEHIRQKFERVYVCSAHWHPQKRLGDNIRLFKELERRSGKSSCLLILGPNPDVMFAGSNIFYAGSVPDDVYMEIYAMADWMIHLAWRDHCPNTVVECLSQNTPVICTDDGGTAEVIDGFGVVLHDSSDPKNLEPFDYDDPPSVDVLQPFDLITRSSCPDVSIETAAAHYMNVFSNLLT